MATLVRFDLHCHSTVSDGVLSPRDLLRLAHRNGVEMIALTDHDETAGLADARSEADELGIAFVNGVEMSVTWKDHSIHVVGLGIDPRDRMLRTGLASLRAGRADRASRIAASLEQAGIPGALEGARAYAAAADSVNRTHFARFLVAQGCAADVRAVFRHYLAGGRPGCVIHRWATLEEAVGWITGAGGIAVLAHPARYRLGGPRLAALLAEFTDVGGRAIELVCGSPSPGEMRNLARLARRFGLLVSCGSDFHGPQESFAGPGITPALPVDLEPVWRRLEVRRAPSQLAAA